MQSLTSFKEGQPGPQSKKQFGDALGRLESCELRQIWTSEAYDFSPWLAQPDNIKLLGDKLGLQLELEARERAVGPFKADILCRDIENEHWVLIENQLERTDHTHLGQLLTYASGLEAVTIIWIAARFTEEHRSTLDWLNKITDEHFRFFGVEVKLWQIDNSRAAPEFDVVAKPNSWSQSVAQAARAIDEDTGLSELRLMRRDYWTGLNRVLDEAGGPVSGHKKPRRTFMQFAIGRSGFRLRAVMPRGNDQVQAGLYIKAAQAKTCFKLLHEQKEAIEREVGYPLTWEEGPDEPNSRISCCLDDADPTNRDNWARQHRWLADKLNDLHRVFAPRVRRLDITDADSGDEPEL